MEVRYAGLIENDIVDGKGFSVSFWTQYCPHRCKGCHNPETWSKDGGILIEYNDLLNKIIKAINANGIIRNFSVLGGEPLCPENINLVNNLIKDIKAIYPQILIYCWTGYTLEELTDNFKNIPEVLNNIDVLIDGRFILEKRDVSLYLRGSSNQRVIDCQKSITSHQIILYE